MKLFSLSLVALSLTAQAQSDSPHPEHSLGSEVRAASLRALPSLGDLESQPTNWSGELVASIQMPGNTGHPQGLIRFGNRFLLSTQDKKNNKAMIIAYDLVEQNGKPKMKFVWEQDISTQGENHQLCHPGGLDSDGSQAKSTVFIPVSATVARSEAQIIGYKVEELRSNKEPGKPSEKNIAAEFKDHSGGFIHLGQKRCAAVNWGTEGIYMADYVGEQISNHGFDIEKKYKLKNSQDFPAQQYQDCKGIGENIAVCGGVGGMAAFLGGGVIDVVEFKDDGSYTILHRTNVGRIADSLPPTYNTLDLELIDEGPGKRKIRYYFAPSDAPNTSLKIYDVEIE